MRNRTRVLIACAVVLGVLGGVELLYIELVHNGDSRIPNNEFLPEPNRQKSILRIRKFALDALRDYDFMDVDEVHVGPPQLEYDLEGNISQMQGIGKKSDDSLHDFAILFDVRHGQNAPHDTTWIVGEIVIDGVKVKRSLYAHANGIESRE